MEAREDLRQNGVPRRRPSSLRPGVHGPLPAPPSRTRDAFTTTSSVRTSSSASSASSGTGHGARAGTRGALVAFHTFTSFSSWPTARGSSLKWEARRAREGAEARISSRSTRGSRERAPLHATPGKNANVLMHALGYFKKDLAPARRRRCSRSSKNSAASSPLVVPVTLLGHYVRKYEQPYLRGQTFLSPIRWSSSSGISVGEDHQAKGDTMGVLGQGR